MLNRVAIFSKDNNQKTRDGVDRLVNELCNRGISIQLHQRSRDDHKNCQGMLLDKFSDFNQLTQKPDLILSVGGDGTFLETVMKVRESGIPVAGVNTGRMGFLANIPGEEIGRSVDQLCSQDYEIVERSMIDIVKPRELFSGESQSALNEITIQKVDFSMITINVFVDEVHLNTYWADGLIVSTATGSTAYNLSVGGPILSPEDESFIVSPISPHNLAIRPIVLSGNSRLRMEIESRSVEYMATCDFRFTRRKISDTVELRKSSSKLKTVMLNGRDFYSTLRSKLMWGIDKRN